MLAINEAKYIGGYRIRILFNNGKEGIANLEKIILDDTRPIFSDLKQRSKFSAFKLEHGTVIWPNNLDLAPEYLFYSAFKDNDDYREKFRQWGYSE
uniref:DUF2442 domain-containing protein n=1 Tax=Candidatus Kentrum sp. LFY TaxID=2126342 RepID=A0A450U5R0_9GAMM|nr:MAG: Protein of unknown function (DUF2442) [Candidatus Kentron sp. LFY]